MDRAPDRNLAKARAFKIAGALVLALGLPLGLLNPLLAVLPCFIGYVLLRRGKKYAVERGASVVTGDKRPPVLYLRSFQDETRESAWLHRFKNVAASDATWLAATVPNNGVQEQDALGHVF